MERSNYKSDNKYGAKVVLFFELGKKKAHF